MSSDRPESKNPQFHDKEPVAYAYDDTDGELIAELYTLEVAAECEDSWWVRVEEVRDDGE